MKIIEELMEPPVEFSDFWNTLGCLSLAFGVGMGSKRKLICAVPLAENNPQNPNHYLIKAQTEREQNRLFPFPVSG